MQTLQAGCSKAEPKIYVAPQTPFPGTRDGQNLISWRWPLPLPTNPVWWGSMHVISSYCGNRPTHKHIHPPTNRTDYNTLRRSSLARCKKTINRWKTITCAQADRHDTVTTMSACVVAVRRHSNTAASAAQLLSSATCHVLHFFQTSNTKCQSCTVS